MQPKSEEEKEKMFDQIIEEFNEIMESEDNFFLIQQIQDRTQILESKKKQFDGIKYDLEKECRELEQMEEVIDNNTQVMNDQLDAIDFDKVGACGDSGFIVAWIA